MPSRLYFLVDVFDLAVGSDDERRPRDALNDLPVHVLVLDDTVRFAHFLVGVTQEREGQVVVLLELLLRFDGILADTDDGGLLPFECGDFIPEIASFDRSARRVGFGIEEQHDRSAAKIAQRHGLVRVRLQRKRRRFLSNGNHRSTLLAISSSVVL